ncbi:rhodopsin, G0-coupled-like [Argopecten irradians]|uniref:rhodopsin, G0-coupled-like n=1 Tax=Argopecten irradians TaxID=31199 RepID=UPI00372455F5
MATNDTLIDDSLLKPFNVSFAVVFLITAIIGIFVNGSILFVFGKKHTSVLNPTTYFVLLLTNLDFFMCSINLPMVIVSSFVGDWVFGTPGCIFYGFTMTWIGLTIIAVLTMISFDQYIVMTKKNYKSKRSRRMSKLACLGCVLWGLVWAICPLVGVNSYVFTVEDVHTSCAVNWKSKAVIDISYTSALFVLCFFVPFAFICFFYVCIYLRVKSCPNIRGVSILSRQEERQKYLAMTIFLMISAFLFSWCPYAIVTLWAIIGDASTIPNMVTLLPAMFAKVAVIWNPLIYAYRNREFKRAWLEIFSQHQ